MIKKKAGITPKKVTKKFVLPQSLPIADFLHIYELYCRRHYVFSDGGYRTWPDVTIEEAYKLISESKLTVGDVTLAGGFVSDSYKLTKKMFSDLGDGVLDTDELKSAFIERRCHLGFAIPLIMQLCPTLMDSVTDLRITLVYAWAACLKDKLIEEQRAAKYAARHSESAYSTLVSFEIECSLEQAVRMDEYIQIRIDAYNFWSDKMREILKDKRRVTAGPPVSGIVTEFRKALKGKVPRSLVSRSMNHAMFDWQQWLNSKRSKSKHPENINTKTHNSVSLANSFSFSEMGTTLTFGEIEKIPIAETREGVLDVTREFKYLIVNGRKKNDSLIYVVTGQYK